MEYSNEVSAQYNGLKDGNMRNLKRAGWLLSLELLPNYELINFQKLNYCNQSFCFEIHWLMKMSLATRCKSFSSIDFLERYPVFWLILYLFVWSVCLPYEFTLLIFNHSSLSRFLIHCLHSIFFILVHFQFSFLNLIAFHFQYYHLTH